MIQARSTAVHTDVENVGQHCCSINVSITLHYVLPKSSWRTDAQKKGGIMLPDIVLDLAVYQHFKMLVWLMLISPMLVPSMLISPRFHQCWFHQCKFHPIALYLLLFILVTFHISRHTTNFETFIFSPPLFSNPLSFPPPFLSLPLSPSLSSSEWHGMNRPLSPSHTIDVPLWEVEIWCWFERLWPTHS